MTEPPDADAPFNLSATPLESDPSVIYALDREFHIRYCNRAWDEFAVDNAGEHLRRASVVGRPLFDFISGPPEAHFREACRRVLEENKAWMQEYECSSAGTFRKFAMHVHPFGGGAGLLVVNSLLVQNPHDEAAHPALEAAYRDSNGLIVMCSNCRRTRRCGEDEVWVWAPGFVSAPPHRVSHGLCPPCVEGYLFALQD